MGDFILYHKDRLPEAKRALVLACLARQGSQNPVLAEHDRWQVQFFPKQLSPVGNFIGTASGDFCGSSGSFIYKGQMGEGALGAFLADFSPEKYRPEDYDGIFTVIVKKGHRLFLLTDPMGGNRIYHNEETGFFSSSFLAAASASPGLSPNIQAIYEYAFQETTYGADTPFQQVSCLDSLKIFEITAEGLKSYGKNLSFDFHPSSQSRDSLIADSAQILRDIVRPVAKIFGDKIRTALSGGYDSRLMLALLQDAGSNPGVYVYGPADSPDVQVAKSIAGGQGFALDHIDKNRHPRPNPDAYKAIIRDNFHALDGLPGESIFDFGANMATRRARSDHGHMIFNGGGGEIFRNFFYLPGQKFPRGNYTISDLLNCFYSRYSRRYCQDNFQENIYRENLRHKIRAALGISSDKLSRGQVEYVYPAFRLRYWTCRDNNNNSRLGSYLTPFISYSIIKQALTIPLAEKNHGVFQGALIKAISPDLASYMSDYGYHFDQEIPAKVKLKNYLTYYRPAFLRRYSYAVQQRGASLHLPDSMARDMVKDIIPAAMPHMSRWFKIENIRDPGLLSRIYSLEYLFRHFRL